MTENKYLIAVTIALFLVALIYFFPTLTGKMLVGHDLQQGIASTQEMKLYKGLYTKFPYWNGTLFSGMPTFQNGANFKNIASAIYQTFAYEMGNPYMYISILIIISSVLLFWSMGLHPLIVFIGASSLLLSEFTVIGLMAGHLNKIMVIAVVPATLAGVWLLYEKKKYLPGLFIIASSVALQIRSNHFQITYFMMFLISIWTLVNLVSWLREKQVKHAVLSVLLLGIGIGSGAVSNTVQLWSTQEYSQETQRGGASPMEAANQEASATQVASSGVSYDYATAWSYGKLESLTLLIPNFAGGASQTSLDENSNVYKSLVAKGVSPMQAMQFASQVPTYWGPQPFTAGTTYIGAVLIFLMVLGLVYMKGTIRYWLIGTLAVTLMVSWGDNFRTFYQLLFSYLPFFNKFRTPSMIFYLTTIVVAMGAVLGLQYLLKEEERREALWDTFVKTAGGVVGVMLFITLILPMVLSFESQTPPDKNTDQMFREQLIQATNSDAFANDIYSALLKDRKAMMQKDAFRSTIFILLTVVLIALFLKRKLSGQLMLAGVAVLVLADSWGVDSRYINHESFKDMQSSGIMGVPMSEADKFILQDKDISYRVLDLSINTFNDASTSAYHKSIGGYHSAKLIRYQDIITYAMSENIRKFSQGQPQEAQVLNMLNTRYIMTSKEASGVIKNNFAYGNAWLVDTVKLLNSPVEVFNELMQHPLDKVALMETAIPGVEPIAVMERDTNAYIRLESYHPEVMKYSYQSSVPSFAVFSEVYYNQEKGWVAYVDGKKAEHHRVNYVLRGMLLPEGSHEIEFRFEPRAVLKGQIFDWAGSALIILIGFAAAFTWYIEKKKQMQEMKA